MTRGWWYPLVWGTLALIVIVGAGLWNAGLL